MKDRHLYTESEKLAARVAELEEQLKNVQAKIDHGMLDQLMRQQVRMGELEAALKPFAEFGNPDHYRDNEYFQRVPREALKRAWEVMGKK